MATGIVFTNCTEPLKNYINTIKLQLKVITSIELEKHFQPPTISGNNTIIFKFNPLEKENLNIFELSRWILYFRDCDWTF